MQKRFAILVLSVFVCTVFVAAQQAPRKSPPASAECKLPDGKTIKSDYSSPRMNGRKIFGGLVPYGQVWRTGANEATTFVTDTPVTIAGKEIPAGSYTLFTIPNEGKWTLIVNKKTAEWGIPYKYEADELLRADMKVEKLSSPMENFTIAFQQKGNACTMSLQWETTNAWVEVAEKK